MDGAGCGFVLERVTVARGPTRLLEDVSAVLPAGQCTAVMGRSGSGKTTLLRLLNRLVDPTAGRVLFGGVAVTELDVLVLRRRVGLVMQQPVLLTDRVASDIRLARPELADDRITDLLERVGFPATFGQRRTEGLSGGEAQRVCLARALAVEPRVLLLDEPTSALDEVNGALVADLAREHVADGGTVVLASHDLTIVRGVADLVLVLDGGRLVATGQPDQLDQLEAG